MKRALFVIACFTLIQAHAQKNTAPYVVLISFDGFRYDYVSRFNPPAFTELIREGAAAEGLIPSFPSKTFPNHYTIVTGLYPGHHGLVDNQFYDPVQHKRYSMSDKNAVRDSTFYGGTPLWQLAQQHGLKSASYFWVGSEARIQGRYPDYYVPYDQSVPNEKRIEQTMTWLKLPEKDRPHFISLYFSLVDSEGHRTGPNSLQVRETVMQADSLLGRLMKELKALDLPINIVVVSDHGMLELKQDEKTYIPIKGMFDTADTTVTFVSGGTQLHLYTRKSDSLYVLLKKNAQHFNVYKRSEMPKQWHYDNARSGDVLIVADPGYYIEYQAARAFGAWPAPFGAHGFDPSVVKEMQGIFYAAGPNIKPGMKLPAFENIHVYPLIAKILGLKTPEIDGDIRVLKNIYKK